MTSLRGAVAALLCVLAWATPVAAQQVPLGSGAWSWFGDPRAVHHAGKTFVGWVDLEGDIKVMSYDHATGERITAVLQARLNQDDHANPSIHLRPDGRLMVFYSAHVGPEMYYRVSSQPGDVSAWSEPQTIPTNTPGGFGFTYPNPIRLDDEQQTYLFWRGGNYNPTYSTQEDGSSAWSPARNLIDMPNQRPYVKYASSGGDTIHVAYTDAHPNEYGDVNIYYARVRGGTIERADGDDIGTLAGGPIAPEQGDRIFDEAEQAWVHDVAADSAGNPVIVFASFHSEDDHRYWYARRTGSGWELHDITPAGGSFRENRRIRDFYSGGLTLDHEDPSRVYLSRQVGPGAWQVEAWTTANGGGDWSRMVLSPPEAERNVRPVSPRGMVDPFDEDLRVIWMRGPYPEYDKYGTSITARWSETNLPPVADAEPTVRSGPAPLPVEFESMSEDPDGVITSWRWDFGDGDSANGPQVTHSYESPGRYFSTLTVTDSSGAQSAFVDEIVVGLAAAPVTHTGGTDGSTAHGAIDPENDETVWYFDYGPSVAYGARTPAARLSGADSLRQVSAPLPGLVQGRLYHYRLVAANDTGTTQGEDRVMVAGSPPESDEYREAVLGTPGLAAYWRLGELSGGSSAGQFGAGPGSFANRFVLGQVGAHGALGDTSAAFDGTGGEFFANGPALAGSGSMEGWFQWRAGNVLMRDHTDAADEGWILGLGNTAALRYRAGGTTFNTGRPIGQVRDGAWHHLVATKDGAGAALYVDGVSVHSGTGAGSLPADRPWHVMRNGSIDVFAAGQADEIALYDRALTPSQVKAHYDLGRALAARPLPPETPNPVPDPPAAGTGLGGGVLTPTPPRGTPAPRPAGTASVRRGTLVVRGAPGTENRLSARRRGRAWRIADAAAPLRAGAGCRRLGPRTVTCRAAGVKRIEMHGGAGADTLTVAGRIPALLVGGPGADRLTGGSGTRFRGGAGADRSFRRP